MNRKGVIYISRDETHDVARRGSGALEDLEDAGVMFARIMALEKALEEGASHQRDLLEFQNRIWKMGWISRTLRLTRLIPVGFDQSRR